MQHVRLGGEPAFTTALRWMDGSVAWLQEELCSYNGCALQLDRMCCVTHSSLRMCPSANFDHPQQFCVLAPPGRIHSLAA